MSWTRLFVSSFVVVVVVVVVVVALLFSNERLVMCLPDVITVSFSHECTCWFVFPSFASAGPADLHLFLHCRPLQPSHLSAYFKTDQKNKNKKDQQEPGKTQ